MSKLALGLGLVKRVSRLFSGEYVQTLQSVVRRLTRNKDLQTVMCYAWGDFGTEPSKAAFLMMADLNNHFLKNGAFYPVPVDFLSRIHDVSIYITTVIQI